MEAELPAPGQTRSLSDKAEAARKPFATWVSTVTDQFTRKDGKILPELVHTERLDRARDTVKELGLVKSGNWLAILHNATTSSVTYTHASRSYVVSLNTSPGQVSCYSSNPVVPPGLFMVIYSTS